MKLINQDTISPRPLYETPKYYTDPSGTGEFGNLANGMKKRTGKLITTWEYFETGLIVAVTPLPLTHSTYLIKFKLKNNYNYENKVLAEYTLKVGTTIFYTVKQETILGILVEGKIEFADKSILYLPSLTYLYGWKYNLRIEDNFLVVELYNPFDLGEQSKPERISLTINQL